MQRRIPVDTSSATFAVAEEPRPVIDFETKQPRIDERSGAPLSSVRLLVTSPDEIAIIAVKIPGLVGSYKVNESVRVIGLVAVPWTNSGKAAISFTAEAIEVVASKAKAA